MRSEDAEDLADQGKHIKRLDRQSEMPGLERPQIQQVVDERLHELELAIHDLAVLDGFWHLVEVNRYVAQDCDHALQEEKYREQRCPHLVA